MLLPMCYHTEPHCSMSKSNSQWLRRHKRYAIKPHHSNRTDWKINTAQNQHIKIRVTTFRSASNSMTFPDTSSYIYIAVQTASNINVTDRNTKAQLMQQHWSTYWKKTTHNVAFSIFLNPQQSTLKMLRCRAHGVHSDPNCNSLNMRIFSYLKPAVT